MSSLTVRTNRVKPSVETLLAEGWALGVPPHLDAWSQAVDAGVCKRLRCPLCKGRGLAYNPMHRGRRYRVLAVCPCGHVEEM